MFAINCPVVFQFACAYVRIRLMYHDFMSRNVITLDENFIQHDSELFFYTSSFHFVILCTSIWYSTNSTDKGHTERPCRTSRVEIKNFGTIRSYYLYTKFAPGSQTSIHESLCCGYFPFLRVNVINGL